MDAAAKMELFGNLVYVSVAIAVIGLGLAIFFFFFFDIRNVYALMTGKAKRQTIERMAEQNSRTGRLQAPVSGNVRDPRTPVVQHPSNVVTADIQPTADMYAAQAPTVNMGGYGAQETTVLGGSAETMVLSGAADTTVLNAPDPGAGETAVLVARPPVEESPSAPQIRFDITESTLVIHTNEII